MVCRQGATPRRELCPALVGQLLRMQFHRQVVRRRGLEDPGRLFGREPDRLTKCVDRIHQPSLQRGRNHLPANQINVIVRTSDKLRRQSVGAEQRRTD